MLKQVESDLNKFVSVSPRILLSRFCFLSDTAQFAEICNDKKHFPFYYYLGKNVSCKNLLEIGFGLGLLSGCFLQGSKTVENFIAYQQPSCEYYDYHLGKKNICSVYKNKFSFLNNLNDLKENKFDVILVNEETPVDQFRAELDTVWKHLEYGGILVINHAKFGNGICKNTLPDFYKIANREAIIINSRYGASVIQR